MKRFLAILLILALLPVPATFARQAEPSAIPEEAFDAVTADVWDEIEAIEAEQIVAKRGKNSDAADYAAIVDDVIAAVEASDTYLEGSLNRNGSFFTWRTTEGVACGYSPRLRARLRKTAIEGANPEDYAGVETTSYATKGGSPSSTSVAVFQPYYGLDSSFKTTYANEGKEIAQAMGGTSTLYKTTSATIDAIADAFESCAVVIFDSHGDTDYYNPIDDEDFVSRANTSYLLLQSGTGLTTADMADVTGTYGTYQHAYYAGSDGSMKYYCVDGTAIANHMDKTSPNGMLWSAICLGMATDGLHAPLRAKGLEVAYGYSQSVTFDYDYKWEAVFWDNMIAGKNVAQSIAAMKSSVGNWDYITQYTTISSARANYCAFPVVVSSEDVYPGKGNVDNLQTVNSTWVLKDSTTPTEPTTAPTEPTTAPIEPTTAPGSDAFVVADSVAANDKIVLVASYNGKNYAMTNDTSISNALVAEEVTVSGDTVDVAATRSAGSEAIWTLEAGAEAGTYLLKSSDGKYINWTSGTTLKLADSGVSFTVTCGKETSSALVTSTIGQATVRGLILRDNGGALQFRAYSTANATASGYSGTLTVYKRAASTTPTEPTTAPTEPTTAPTEPTTAPTEPTTAPTEPTTAPSGNEYVLTTSLKDGDEVVIYNASAGKAMSEDAVSTNYRAGADVAVSGNKIVTDDSRIVWTVKASGSGFTFANDAGETLSATKGLSFATTDNVWAINPATTANSVYIVSTTAAGSQGDPKYVEWYAQYSEFSTYYYNVNNEAIFAMQLFAKSGGTVTPTEPTTAPTEPTTAPTEPTTAPTEPTTAPTEPTTAPTEPTTPPSGGAPIEEGDCVVIYNAANGVIIGYDEDTDYSQSTGDFTYWNITTEAVSVSGSTLKAEYENAGTFYVIANADGTYAFLDQYDYDQSSVSYFISAETPYTYYDSSADYAAFELIPAEGGYLLKNVGDNSYYAIENGVVVAKELVAGDPNFIFRFAIWDGTTEGDDTIVCTLVGSSTPDQPTTAPTEPTTAPTEPTSGPTEPTTAPSGNEYVLTTSLKDGDQVIIYNASAKKAMSEDAVSTNYRAGADVTVSGNKIVTDDSKIVWTVKASGSGFTFTNDAGETLSATKGLSFATTDNVWAINPATTANSVYIVSTTAAGSQGDPKYVEWYAQYSEFSTYYYSAASEAIFAMQLFAKSSGTVTPTEPTTAPTEPTTAPTEPTTAPTEPTTAPTEPTTAPTEPTSAPTQPTTAPTEPTEPVTEYKVTVKSDNEEHGRVTIMDNVVTATPDNGYYACGFLLEPADAATVLQSGNYFYLSNITKDCVLTVQFREKDRAEIRFSVPAGCSAKRITTWIDEPTALKAPEGKVKADMHEYVFLGWSETTVKDEKEKPVYFTDIYTPEKALTTLYALYTYEYRGETFYTTALQMKTCLAKEFNDVDVKEWYHDALDFVLEYGYMNGVDVFKFDPNGKLTRGMMVTILYRLEEREGKFTHPFTDVKMDAWYAEAVAWAYENGVVNGTSTTTFSPNEPITREQTAAMLYRYAKWSGEDVTPKGSLMNFVDADKVSAYARDPMRWAVGEGIINGKGKIAEKPTGTDKNEPTDILDPLGTATRAEIAQILYGWLS